jgi:hypothetical protein
MLPGGISVLSGRRNVRDSSQCSKDKVLEDQKNVCVYFKLPIIFKKQR